MLEPGTRPKRVTFSAKRTGPRVTVRALIGVLESATQWLRTLDPDSPVDWEVVRVSMGQRVSLTFSNPNANGAVSSRMGELSALQRVKPPVVPPRFSEDVIKKTKELAEAVLEGGLEALNISSRGAKTVKVNNALVSRVEALAKTPKPPQRTEWTTLEGVMDQVTVEADTDKSQFRINHPLTGAEIPCTFDQAEVDLEDVKSALPHRVAIYGRARLDRGGKVVSIEVVRLRQLPDANSFPSIASIPKTNITGGMESSDYVERVRGGE